MKKQIYLMLMIAIILFVIPINLADARMTYWQTKYVSPFISNNITYNNTVRNHAFITYDAETDDYISKGKPLEVYVSYRIENLASWNLANPIYAVDSCSFLIRENHYILDSSGHIISSQQVNFTQNYTEENSGYFELKHFVRLNNKDSFTVDLDCHFLNNFSLDIPADFNIVMPTWECKECQLYEWAVTEVSLDKAQDLRLKTSNIFTYIKNLVDLNYQIWIAIFWIFLIIIFLFVIGLIFLGVYWFYLFLKNIISGGIR